MTLRTLARETRDYPATTLFSLIWVLVFAAMVASRFTEGPPVTWRQFLLVGMNDGHRFGDLTIKELSHGEIWRLVTCTFVHYSLIHILLNILAFYLLGTMIESWYGSWQFIFIYLLTGSLGNLLSALGRQAAHYSPTTHSAGGSTVIMGLIGLCLVVGWRSRSSREGELRWHMLVSLGLTALLGFVFRDYIDNWGHAGGALVGFGLGFADRRFLRGVRRPSAWGLGVMAGLVIVFCGMAQLAADRREAPLRRQALLRAEVYARRDRLPQSPRCPDASGSEGRPSSPCPRAGRPGGGARPRRDSLRLSQAARAGRRSGNRSALGSGEGRVQAAGRGSFSTASRRARRSPPRVLEGTPQDGRQEPVNGTFGPLCPRGISGSRIPAPCAFVRPGPFGL